MYKFLLVALMSFCTFFYSPVQANQSAEDSYNEIQAIANYIISHEGYQQLFYNEEMLENGDSIAFEEHLLESPEEPYLHTFQSLTDQTLTDYIEAGRYGNQEVAENFRITFINGIMNAKEDLLNSVQAISISHGHAPVHYVFQATEGWSWDLLRSILSKLGFISSHARALAYLWKSLIEEMGGPEGGGTIIHYAHSIGGTNTLAAKSLLSPEEQSMIQVVTLGSPTMIPDEGFQSVINYVSVHDWVTLLDPANRLLSYFKDYAHIICVGDPDNPPITKNFFVDHLLEDDTYKSLIISHGKKFIELFSNN